MSDNKKINISVIVILAALAFSACSPRQTPSGQIPLVSTSTQAPTNPASEQAPAAGQALPEKQTPLVSTATELAPPISQALKRVTKKPFGIYITPQNSPVGPEKFTGYHAGVDFEILPGEENIDVPIYAICSGTLRLKKFASGYGGVAVKQCELNGEDVTVVYGHLRVTSIGFKTGDNIAAGEQIGVLGKGDGPETDGERKHLHLSIYKGTTINILGYVQNEKDLAGWLDPMKYLR